MPLKNHQNFQGGMANEYSIDGIPLRQRIEAMPEDCRDSLIFKGGYGESLDFDALMQRIRLLQERVAQL